MSEIEAELVKFAKLRQTAGDFDERQDYLAALVKAVSKAADKDPDGYDEISAEAADWYTDAVTAHNQHDELPDFTDAEIEGAEDEAKDEDEEPEAEEPEPEAEPVPEEPISDDHAEEADAEAANEAEEAASEIATEDDEPKPVKAKAKRKGKKSADKATVAAKPKAKAKKDKPKPEARNYETIQRDKFGVTFGTKTHDALMLYESGKYTRIEVSEKMGGKYYNILKEMVKAGHRVEMSPDNKIKLTHKEDFGKKAKGK